MSLRSHVRADSAVLVCGLLCLGLRFLALDSSCSGLLLLLRNHLCIGFTALLVDLACLGLTVSLRSFSCIALTVLISGTACTGPLLLLRSFSCLDPVAPASMANGPSSSMLLQAFACLGLFAPFLGKAQLESMAPTVDVSQTELSVSAQSFTYLEIAALAPSFARPGPPLPTRSLACLGLLVLPVGSLQLQSVLTLSIIDHTHLEPPVLVRSFTCAGSTLSSPELGVAGSPLLCLGRILDGIVERVVGVVGG
ncbi:unnamed protein product [Symbiodinium natans]|uniref:Uncharacterized protein n=1 Tax=Symbiodinium natans TaxID=878477 RepID=A0A812M7I2_9DINO|nr:unnamed protein product [Symbiodinium natans]